MIQLEIPLNSTVPDAAAPRLSAQHHAILKRLSEGPVRNTELTHIALRYSGRIYELRKAGYDIRKYAVSEERGIYEYSMSSPLLDDHEIRQASPTQARLGFPGVDSSEEIAS